MEARPAAVGLFSVRRQLIDDFEGTLSKIAAMGYAGVEPAVFGPIPLEVLPEDMRVPTPEPAAFRTMLDRLGLQTTSLHAPLPEGDVANWTLDFAEALGTDQLVLASFLALPDCANAHADAAVLARAIERFDDAAENASARGIALGFHNHHFEWQADLGGGFAWDLFWERVDPRVNAEVDVYWAQTAGRDPADEIARLGARVRRIHLKDGPCVLGEPQVALGRGLVDIGACVRAARHSDWHIVELDECATDIFDALETSLHHLVDGGFSTATR